MTKAHIKQLSRISIFDIRQPCYSYTYGNVYLHSALQCERRLQWTILAIVNLKQSAAMIHSVVQKERGGSAVHNACILCAAHREG